MCAAVSGRKRAAPMVTQYWTIVLSGFGSLDLCCRQVGQRFSYLFGRSEKQCSALRPLRPVRGRHRSQRALSDAPVPAEVPPDPLERPGVYSVPGICPTSFWITNLFARSIQRFG